MCLNSSTDKIPYFMDTFKRYVLVQLKQCNKLKYFRFVLETRRGFKNISLSKVKTLEVYAMVKITQSFTQYSNECKVDTRTYLSRCDRKCILCNMDNIEGG